MRGQRHVRVGQRGIASAEASDDVAAGEPAVTRRGIDARADGQRKALRPAGRRVRLHRRERNGRFGEQLLETGGSDGSDRVEPCVAGPRIPLRVHPRDVRVGVARGSAIPRRARVFFRQPADDHADRTVFGRVPDLQLERSKVGALLARKAGRSVGQDEHDLAGHIEAGVVVIVECRSGDAKAREDDRRLQVHLVLDVVRHDRDVGGILECRWRRSSLTRVTLPCVSVLSTRGTAWKKVPSSPAGSRPFTSRTDAA